MASDSRGSRTLLLFGLITLLSGLELCGQRWVDLFALRPAETLTSTQLHEAGTYDRVRFDPKQLRLNDALYYRPDLKTFSEHDPRDVIRVTGPTEAAALSARRRELHGAHIVVEDVRLASPPFLVDRDTKPSSLRGEAFVERMFAALSGTGDGLYAAPVIAGDRNAAIAAFAPRARFEGTLVALGEADRYDELADVLRVSGRVDPDRIVPYMILDGQPAAARAMRVIPLGETYNLFVVAPEGVDLATTPAEGTIDKAIDNVVVRKSLRQMIFTVRKQAQEYKPIRFIYPGSAAAFRASPDAPMLVHPGGGVLLALGVICSVLGIVWGARRDRSGTESKLWFEAIVGMLEVAAVAVPATYFLLNRANQPPAPFMTGAPAAAPVFAPASASAPPPAVVAEKAEDVESAAAAIAEIKKATTPTMLALDASLAEAACLKVKNDICVRDRALNELQAGLALLAKSNADKKSICLQMSRAARRLVEAKMDGEQPVYDALVAIGKACL